MKFLLQSFLQSEYTYIHINLSGTPPNAQLKC